MPVSTSDIQSKMSIRAVFDWIRTQPERTFWRGLEADKCVLACYLNANTPYRWQVSYEVSKTMPDPPNIWFYNPPWVDEFLHWNLRRPDYQVSTRDCLIKLRMLYQKYQEAL